ncbi:MAG: bifunctional hydroxymethylpyrimidine kinase/phosphomethylpyrimidine kinase [Planctomycetota bacterium]
MQSNPTGTHHPPKILTIAGSDSGGGAGIQADLKTITVLGGYGMSAITALTAQNTDEVLGIHASPPDFVRLQIDAVADDIGIDSAKTGMLHNAPIIVAVAEAISYHNIPNLVVDPVMIAKGGARLLEKEAEQMLCERLLPCATILTPNLPEAASICNHPVQTLQEMRDAAREIHYMGPTTVLIKGGHLEGDPVDLFYDGSSFHELEFRRINTTNTHGTGCTYSAAIATYLGRGMDVIDAVHSARSAIQTGIENALSLGKGHGPLDHLAMFWKES